MVVNILLAFSVMKLESVPAVVGWYLHHIQNKRLLSATCMKTFSLEKETLTDLFTVEYVMLSSFLLLLYLVEYAIESNHCLKSFIIYSPVIFV